MQRTIFIGDVHGCYHELLTLIANLQLTAHDRVILLGDLINRGPYPEQVVRYVYEQGFACLRGNHEEDYSRHFHHPQLSLPLAYARLKRALPEPVHNWLINLPLYLDEPEYTAVHAGLHPIKPLHETERAFLLAVRNCDQYGKNIDRAANSPWYTYYKGTKKVFYGHWAAQGLTIRANTVGLDSGCVYGKMLSAYILETNEVVQVKAASAYVPVN
jgi:bis(5'-nucleosyl)-tetraphosphatase (symmetrical)